MSSKHRPVDESPFANDDGPSPYRRDDYFGTDTAEARGTRDDFGTLPGTSWQSFVAHGLLKQSATILCGRTLDDGGETELSPPKAYPPTERVSENRHARRVNPETGWMNWGNDTYVAIKDRPAHEFIALVEDIVHKIKDTELPPRRKQQIIDVAARKKRTSNERCNQRDVEIMEWVAAAMVNPDAVLED